MDKNTDQIAAEAAREWLLRLRQWQGFDLTEYQQASLIESFQSAIEKATEPFKRQLESAGDLESEIVRLKAESRAAHASEQGAGYRLAKLLRDEYWAQTPLDVAKLADEVLSQRPTPAKECCDTKKGFGKCKHDEPTPATASEHECTYSRQMNQPYPRHCIVCGKVEGKPDSASASEGKWTPAFLVQIAPEIHYQHLQPICDAHNQSLQPRDTVSEDEWFDDSPAAKKPDSPLVENYLRMFVQDILHGDEDHRKWLLESVECFIEGKHIPERP